MLWSQQWIRPKYGYAYPTVNGRALKSETLNGPGNPSTYRFDSVIGNTNYKGRWSWKVAENLDNNAAQCYNWYNKQPSEGYISVIRNHARTDCPCLWIQARFDRRFRRSSSSSSMVCYQDRATFFFIGTFVSFYTKCCYDRRDGSLINDVNNAEMGTNTQKHITQAYNWFNVLFSRSIRRSARRQALQDDERAFEYCCQRTSLCNLYLEKRPVPTCSLYTPPIMGTFKLLEFMKMKLYIFAISLYFFVVIFM